MTYFESNNADILARSVFVSSDGLDCNILNGAFGRHSNELGIFLKFNFKSLEF